jgi:hypothetical protein
VAYDLYSFRVATHFGDSAEELTTSRTSSMKGGDSGHNGFDLDKGNILKSTFDILTEEGHKAFEAYRANLEELFLSHCEVTRQGTVLKDTTPIIFTKPEVMPEVRPNKSPSLNDVQNMINSALERQVKSTDELLRRLIEERDGKKLNTTSTNHSSSTCAVNFTQTNPHTSSPSTGGTSMSNPSTHPMNHFHSQTTIEGSAPNLGMQQQATASMYGQGYTHTAPSFTMPNPSLTPYTFGFNGRVYPNPSSNFQALYTTIAYTDLIPLPGSSLGFLPNHIYQTPPCFNTYGQSEAGGFGYEAPPQFLFRPQPVDMMPA